MNGFPGVRNERHFQSVINMIVYIKRQFAVFLLRILNNVVQNIAKHS